MTGIAMNAEWWIYGYSLSIVTKVWRNKNDFSNTSRERIKEP